MKDITSNELIESYMERSVLGEIFEPSAFSHFRLFSYENGEQICVEGEGLKYLIFLLEGRAKPYGMLANGKVYLFRIEEPLSVYGDMELLRSQSYSANVEAVGSALCLAVPIPYIRQHCLDSPAFLKYIISTLADRLDMISRGSAENLLMPVKNKLAVMLLSGTAGSEDSYYVGSSYVEMAENLGTTYRHLSRVLREMSDEKLIVKKGKSIGILNRKALEELAEELNR